MSPVENIERWKPSYRKHENTCMVCGELYLATYADVKRPVCSKVCRAVLRTRAAQCHQCGKMFRSTASKSQTVKFCSRACVAESKKRGLKSGVCLQCAGVFVKRSKGHQFCSNACQSACRSESGLGGKKGVWARTQAALQKPWTPPVSDWERAIRRELSKLKKRSRPVDPWHAKCQAMANGSRHRTAQARTQGLRETVRTWDDAVRQAIQRLDSRVRRQRKILENPWYRWCENKVSNNRKRLRRKQMARLRRDVS